MSWDMGEGELVKTFNIDRYRTVTLFDLTVLKFTRELGGVVRTHQLIDMLSKIYAIRPQHGDARGHGVHQTTRQNIAVS